MNPAGKSDNSCIVQDGISESGTGLSDMPDIMAPDL